MFAEDESADQARGRCAFSLTLSVTPPLLLRPLYWYHYPWWVIQLINSVRAVIKTSMGSRNGSGGGQLIFFRRSTKMPHPAPPPRFRDLCAFRGHYYLYTILKGFIFYIFFPLSGTRLQMNMICKLTTIADYYRPRKAFYLWTKTVFTYQTVIFAFFRVVFICVQSISDPIRETISITVTKRYLSDGENPIRGNRVCTYKRLVWKP